MGQGPGTFPGVGFVAAGGIYYQRQNVDAVTVRGVEAALQWSDGPWSIGGARARPARGSTRLATPSRWTAFAPPKLPLFGQPFRGMGQRW